MKKLFSNLPFRLILALAIGIGLATMGVGGLGRHPGGLGEPRRRLVLTRCHMRVAGERVADEDRV